MLGLKKTMNDTEILFLHEDLDEENDDALGAEDLNLISWDIEEEKYDGKSLIVTNLTEKVGSEVCCKCRYQELFWTSCGC